MKCRAVSLRALSPVGLPLLLFDELAYNLPFEVRKRYCGSEESPLDSLAAEKPARASILSANPSGECTGENYGCARIRKAE